MRSTISPLDDLSGECGQWANKQLEALPEDLVEIPFERVKSAQCYTEVLQILAGLGALASKNKQQEALDAVVRVAAIWSGLRWRHLQAKDDLV